MLRLGLGITVIVDLLLRSRDLSAHYTDFGVLPRPVLDEWMKFRTLVSVHALSGEAWWQVLLFLCAAASAAALIVGYRARLAAGICWFLTLSLHVRNPAVVSGGDSLLRMLLFWSMFLPIGDRWSIDSRRVVAPRRGPVVSVGAVAIRLQLCLMYWTTAAVKTGPSWRQDHTALLRALNLDFLVTSWGVVLRSVPEVLEWLTIATLWLEVVGPILAWSPVLIGPIRFLLVLVFVGFHMIGIGPALRVGPFSPVAAFAWSVFLPSWFWRQLSTRYGALEEPEPAGAGDEGAPRWRRVAGRAWQGVAAVVLVGTVLYCVRLAGGERLQWALPERAALALEFIGFHQVWRMFSPDISNDDGWYVVVGRLENGGVIDPWRGEPPDFARPDDIGALYRNHRWEKYLSGMADREPFRVSQFTAYLCRSWNARAGPRLEELDLFFVWEPFDPETGVGEPEPQYVGSQRCKSPANAAEKSDSAMAD